MKRLTAILCIVCSMALFAACGGGNSSSTATPDSTGTGTPAPKKEIHQAAKLPTFETVDLAGKKADNAIFKDHKLTMVNFWATYCNYCIGEMPELEELNQRLPEGVQIIGVVGDVKADDAELIETANGIISQQKVSYANIVPDDVLFEYMQNLVPGFPTTVFVDSEGNQVGDMLIGAQGIEIYESEINKRLE